MTPAEWFNILQNHTLNQTTCACGARFYLDNDSRVSERHRAHIAVIIAETEEQRSATNT